MTIKEQNANKYFIALNVLRDNANKTDIDIARILIGDYSEFKEKRLETLRRYVCILRTENNLKVNKSTDKLYKDIDNYLKKYSNDSFVSIANKLQIKHRQYTAGTLENYIKQYAGWNYKRKYTLKHS